MSHPQRAGERKGTGMDEMRYDPPVPPPPGDPGPIRSEAPAASRPQYGALIALLVVGLVVGFAVGGAGPDAAPVAAAAPATVSVPQACLEAAHAGQRGMDLGAEGFGLAADALTALGDMDWIELDRLTDKVNDLAGPISDTRDELDAATAECEEAAA